MTATGRSVPAAALASAPARVMICDDSAVIRGAIGRMLEADPGIVVVARAANGREALRQVQVRPGSIDVVVLDIEMPEMDGIAFVREIRSQGAWASLPVIALSSLQTDAAVERGREAGFDAYISKFDKAILLEAVQRGIASGLAGAWPKLMAIEGTGA